MLRIICIATLGFIALLAAAEFVVVDRAISIARTSATGIALTEQERMLSQRIAALAAQTGLNERSAPGRLHAAILAFEETHWRLVGGDAGAGLRSIFADPDQKALYFGGRTPLDARATAFATRARRVAALSPRDPARGSETAALIGAAQSPLADGFNAALKLRRDRMEARLGLIRQTGFAIAALMLTALAAAGAAGYGMLLRRIRRLEHERETLAGLVAVDPLTGLLNRRSFDARGAVELHKARRYGRPLSLIIIDADQLPMIETTYGRPGGEQFLRALTTSVCDGTRMCDLIARVNAEQFAVLLPETDIEGAEILAERLRRDISDLSVSIADSRVSCTVSIGVAVAEKDASFLSPIFKRADQALFEAKMRGSNQVVVAA